MAAKFIVFAFDATTNLPKTGDAANLTAYVSKDYGTVTVLADTSATEMDATNAPGYYLFDAAQGETNADCLMVSGKSATANIKLLGAPAVIYTRPTTGWLAPTTAGRTLVVDANGLADANVVKLGPTGSGTAQTARDIGASVLLSSGTGTGQLDFTSGILKVDVNTIKTNPVVNAGTITFPTNATLASTTNITAGTITTVTTVTNQLTAAAIATGVWQDTTAGDFTAALSIGKSVMNGVALGTGLTINAYTGNTVQTGDSFARIGVAGAGLTNIDLPNQTMDIVGNITGNLSGSVGSVTGLTASDVGAIKTKTDFLPSATAGSAGGVFIAGSNAATTTASLTTGAISATTITASGTTSLAAVTTSGTVTLNALTITNAYTVSGATTLTGAVTATNAGNDIRGVLATVSGTVTVGTNNDKTGYSLVAGYDAAKTAAQAGDAMTLTAGERTTLTAAIWAYVVTGSTTAVQAMRGFIAAMLGKASGLPTAPKYRNIADTKDVISATTDTDGNRTAVTLDLT